MGKQFEYAAKIISQISAMFEEDGDNLINVEELVDEENLKAFMHALSTIAPCALFNRLLSDNKDHLEFNHVANHLIFDFSKSVKS